MAKGRFVSKQITIDKKVNDLKDPWSMLGFTWMIPHADCEGRLYGDPAVLKSIIFPRQNGNIEIEQLENYIFDWQDIGLITYYEDSNDKYIQLINFEKHQTGLRKDREPESIIPGFNPDTCRMLSGKNRVKLSLSKVKVKLSRSEGEITSTPSFDIETSELVETKNIKFEPTDELFCDNSFLQVTGFLPTMKTAEVRRVILFLSEKHGIKERAKMADFLRPYYLESIKRKNKQGQNYSKSNTFWILEWAACGEIPPVKSSDKPNTFKQQSPEEIAAIRSQLAKDKK